MVMINLVITGNENRKLSKDDTCQTNKQTKKQND